ncbi:MAG: hypothetical protein WB797_07145 [Nocardioides sp.]
MTDDDLTTSLTRELRERADAVHGSTLALADVTGRARSIRRRRTAAAVAGVAAAVAVIVPAASLAGHHNGHRTEPAPITHSTPAAPEQPAAGVLDVSGLPTGEAPHLEYVTDGRTLHLANGGTVDLPTRYPVSAFVALSDGSHLWLTTHHGTPYVEVEDGDGGFRDPVPSGWDLTVDSTHTVGAWVRPDGQVMVWNTGATEPLAYLDPVPASGDLRMGPVLGSRCTSADPCEVYVNVSDQQAQGGWQPWVVSVNGTEPLRDGDYRILADSTESGLSVGYRTITDSGSCSVLLGGGEFHGFRTCRHTLVSFSPGGTTLLADPAYHDGIGNGVIAMYDLEGKVLFERHSTEGAQSFYPEAQWEDDGHVLAPVFQDGTWAIVRFATDGSMEYAVPPVAGRDTGNPYVLATGGVPSAG